MKICPICTLTAGTWITLLIYRELGHAVDPVILAILMGGSVVGIAYTLNRSSAWFKLAFVPVGFVAVYAIVSQYWLMSLVATVAAAAVACAFLWRPGRMVDSAVVRQAEEQLKQCC